MPILEGADLSTVSTVNQPLPAGTYLAVIKSVEQGKSSGDLPQVTIILSIEGGDYDGRQIREWLTLRQHDGKPNEVSLKQLKRYYEAVVGEERANAPQPDTDWLVNGKVQIVLDIKNDRNDVPRNNVKRVLAV